MESEPAERPEPATSKGFSGVYYPRKKWGKFAPQDFMYRQIGMPARSLAVKTGRYPKAAVQPGRPARPRLQVSV